MIKRELLMSVDITSAPASTPKSLVPGEVQQPMQPVSGTVVPRFAGPSTFARLPELRDVQRCHVALLGIPFDAGTSYRPGARFGPQAIRQASRHLRTQYHPAYDTEPFREQQVADAGDVACNPYNIAEALTQIQAAAADLLGRVDHIVSLGGDHTIALPLLRAVHQHVGPVALVHFDAHLDTWDTYFGAPYTHGTPFRRAAEEGLFRDDASMHVGIRGPLYSRDDLKRDAALGFRVVHCDAVDTEGIDSIMARLRQRVGQHPLYVSIDIDVLDPAYAPGTGTPEVGGLTTRELLRMLRGLTGLTIIAADIVEVAPVYDHAEVTSLAAATVAYELVNLFARGPKRLHP
jgi:agmatinase